MSITTLHSRAATFAWWAGGVTFFLAVLATARGALSEGDYSRMLVPAIVCAALAWASAQARIADTAQAIDVAVDRLASAAAGDLSARVPAMTHEKVPQLAAAMEALFTQLTTNFERVEHLALFDPVTGLSNRSSFRAAAEAMLIDLNGQGAALFFVDLDRFKRVNDTRGHACGDQLLAQVAQRIRHVAETEAAAGSLVGRLAGDEFTLLCPLTGPDDVPRIGAALLEAIRQPYFLAAGEVSIGASIGVALSPEHGDELQSLMRAADAAMYQSKAGGRARLSRYDDRIAAEIVDREALDRDMIGAIARGEFELMFQPQVRAQDGALVASEALLRWRHPILGLRPPAAFLARADQTGQIGAIGDWVVDAAMAAIAEWERARQPGALSLNVSLRQMEDPAFFDRLRVAADRAGVRMDRLELELSEAAAMSCPAAAVSGLTSLRRAGARIVVDDFGAGSSNLQRLRTLPIDRIKLDGSLIRDIEIDSRARNILQALIGLVHGLGCEAVAEAVESDAQIDVLRVLGCDLLQGYAVARPMAAPALAAWITRSTAWPLASAG